MEYFGKLEQSNTKNLKYFKINKNLFFQAKLILIILNIPLIKDFKGTDMRIEKAMINGRLRVLKVP